MALVLVIILVGAVAIGLLTRGDDSQESDLASQTATSAGAGSQDAENAGQSQETEADVVLTAEEVAMHDSPTDCWTIVSGSVYDITSYIPRHPGGNEILSACGLDGTTLFEQREDSQGESVGSGTPHSSSARSMLESYLLGELAQ